MPENVRAAIVLFVLLTPALLLMRRQLALLAIERENFNRRALAWAGVTAALFFSYGYWTFLLVATVVVWVASRRDSNRIGFYLFVLLAAPPMWSIISGFGPISKLIEFDYMRMLSLVLLAPLAISLSRGPSRLSWFRLPADKYLVAYVALQIVITATTTSATDTLRTLLAYGIDIVLPYYVCSRALTSAVAFKDAFGSLVTAGVLLAVIGVFESFKGWLLYSSLANYLDIRYAMGGYMMREGALRAAATTGHSILLGYALGIAIGLNFALRRAYAGRSGWTTAFAVLVAGLGSSYARGPWVGAAVAIVVAWALGAGGAGRLAKSAVAAALTAAAVLITPLGARVLAVLPFVGTSEGDSVDYRHRLFQVSWEVLMMNPILGSPYYLQSAAMEQMRQGEGIIDMVNAYLQVALASGLLGLALFLGVFLSSGWRLLRILRRHPDKSGDAFRIGVALLAAQIAALVTIATTSSIGAVPVLYWCLAGSSAAYVAWVRQTQLLSVTGSTESSWQRRAARPFAAGELP